MSSLRKYYESPEYFRRLQELNGQPDVSETRNAALISLLDGVPTGLDILDAGCGLGNFSQTLRGQNRITGADVNDGCLAEVAKAGYETRHFDLEQPWPLPEESFDLILFGDVLEHLFATTDVLTFARQSLRKDGRIAVAVPNVGYWRRRMRLLIKGALKNELDDHIRFFSPRTLARAAQEVNLEVVGCRSYAWSRQTFNGLPLSLSWGFVSLLRRV